MEREFIKGLGIEDKEVIDKIMEQNGSDIENAKKTLTNEKNELENKLKQANEALENIKNSKEVPQEVQDELDKYKAQVAQLEQEKGDILKQSVIKQTLLKHKANDKYMDALMSYVPKDVDIDGLDEAIKDIKENYGELFIQDKEVKFEDNKLKGGKTPALTKESIMSIEDKEERQKAIAENLELFN